MNEKEKELDRFYRDSAIIMLADIPELEDDNSPKLIEAMESVYKKYLDDYRARLAGKTIIERIRGCEYMVPEREIMESTCIEEQIYRLKRFDKMVLTSTRRHKLDLYLSYIKSKKEGLKSVKPITPGITSRLFALYIIYKGYTLKKDNIAKYAEKLNFSGNHDDAIKKYNDYQITNTRLYNQLHKDDLRVAKEMLKSLKELKMIFESRSKIDDVNSALDNLKSDIDTLDKNISNVENTI